MSEQQALLARINARRQEIAVQRADLAEQFDQLKKLDAGLEQEEAELTITERHIAKFTQGELERPVTELGARVLATRIAQETAQRSKRKPDGVPSVLWMTEEILAKLAAKGQHWLEPVQIVTEIKKQWWPGAEVGFISPQLWRAAQKGRLSKDGTRYALPQNEKAPNGVAAEASQSNGALLPPA